jgi:serine/threonine protein kinase
MPVDGQIFKGHQGEYSVKALRPLGFGRESVIWNAVSGTGDELIIKLFRGTPKSWRRTNALSDFIRETEVHSKLSHQNILPILDWGIDSEGLQTAPFLVLPLCKYGDVRQAIQAQSFIPFERGIRILQQLAAAVDYAHSCGVLHGDIKPENALFWRSPDHACLADVGASRYYPQSVEVSAEALGTPDYLSPEELDGRRATPASDLYSFALVAYEILTGALPFDHAVASKSIHSRLHGELENALKKNPLLPSWVGRVFGAAFALDPALRPRSATLFVESLVTEPAAGNPRIVVSQVEKSAHRATTVDDSGRQQHPVEQRRSRYTPEQRIVLWTAIIGGIVTIVTALIAAIFPSVFSRGSPASDASQRQPTPQSTLTRDSTQARQ